MSPHYGTTRGRTKECHWPHAAGSDHHLNEKLFPLQYLSSALYFPKLQPPGKGKVVKVFISILAEQTVKFESGAKRQ